MQKLLSLKKNRKHLLFIISAFLISYLLFFILPFYQQIDQLAEKSFFELRYRLKGKEKTDSALCVFNVDDQDVEELKIKPYDRLIFSQLIKIFTAAEAKTVTFDLFFKENIDPESDNQLARSTREAGNLFYPIFLSDTSGETGQNEELVKKIIRVPKVTKAGSPFDSKSFRPPFYELAAASKGLGTITLKPDSDAISRRLPLLVSYENRNEYIPSMVLTAICHFLEIDLNSMEVAFGEHIRLTGSPGAGKEAKEYLIPIDSRGRMIINYSGPWQDSTENYSLRDVFNMQQEEPWLLNELLAGTFILVSDISSAKKDYSRGLFETYYPNSGILSNAINTILTGNYLTEPGLVFSIFISLVLIIITWVAASRFELRNFTILIILLLLLYLILEALFFINLNLLPRTAIHLSGILVSLFAVILYKGNAKHRNYISAPENAPTPIKSEELDKLAAIEAIKINEQACRDYKITPAQRRLLKVLQPGLTYKKAAEILGITRGTVNQQIRRIKERTDIYDKKDLLNLFFPLSDNEQ